MIKNIYGIYDSVTGNVGDICILDKDEEFRDGCLRLFSDPRVPAYHVNDLLGVCYGQLHFGLGDHPKIVPGYKVILRGDSFDVANLRKEVVNDAEIHEDFEADS